MMIGSLSKKMESFLKVLEARRNYNRGSTIVCPVLQYLWNVICTEDDVFNASTSDVASVARFDS